MKKVVKSLFAIALVALLGFFATNFMQAEAAASGDNNPCDGNSLVATYYGKEINLVDYVNDYLTNPKLEVLKNADYNGVETYGVYQNPTFSNYKYYCKKSTAYTFVDILKQDPITSFVKEEYLHKEGDWGLIGDEYGYYIHCEHIEDAFVYPANLSIDNVKYLDSHPDRRYAELYKSSITLVKYNMEIEKCGNYKFAFSPLILAEMEVFAVNNETEYTDARIERILTKDNVQVLKPTCFIHKKGWSVFPYLISNEYPDRYVDASTFIIRDRERFQKVIEQTGFSSVYLPALRQDYCLSKNSFLACEESNEDVYKLSAQILLDSFDEYGIKDEKNPIEKITVIDFSKDDSYFTINESLNNDSLNNDPLYFYYFDGKYIYETSRIAPKGNNNTNDGEITVETIAYNGIEIKYYQNEFISLFQPNMAYYSRVYSLTKDWSFEEKASLVGDGAILLKDLSGISVPVLDQFLKADEVVEYIKKVNEAMWSHNNSEHLEKIDNSLMPAVTDSHCAYVNVDEYSKDGLKNTYFFGPSDCKNMMNDPAYNGMFFTEIYGSPLHKHISSDYQLPITVSFAYKCEFCQVLGDPQVVGFGYMKPIEIYYINNRKVYTRTFQLNDFNDEIYIEDIVIDGSNNEALLSFDLDNKAINKKRGYFTVPKDGYYSIACIGDYSYNLDDLEAILYNSNDQQIYRFTHINDYKEVYLKAGEKISVSLRKTDINSKGQIYIKLSLPERFTVGEQYGFRYQPSLSSIINYKEFKIDRPANVEIRKLTVNGSKTDYSLFVYANGKLIKSISGDEISSKLLLNDITATYRIEVQDNRSNKYDSSYLKVIINTEPYFMHQGNKPIMMGDGNGKFEPIYK